MVLYDPIRRWRAQAICTDPDDYRLFFAEGGNCNTPPHAKVQAMWDEAKEICKGCPVLQECARDTLGEHYGVWGGLDQHQRWKIRQALNKAVRTWPREKQLTWGKELSALRAQGNSWKAIQDMTGLPETPAVYLANEWAEHLATLPKPVAGIIDLPLPEPEERKKTPFPDKPGRCHAWVRRKASNLVTSAWYRGQTADGAWIYVQFQGRAGSHMWARAEDVWIYSPQPVVIMDYKARPPDAISA